MKTFVLFTLCLLSLNSYALNVVIDPGHGGKDRGAVYYEIEEAKLNLQVSKYLKELLKDDPRFNVTLTRERDVHLEHKKRTDHAKKFKGDIFLSIHVNAFNYPHTHGAEFYFQNQLPPDQEAMYLAQKENEDKTAHRHTDWPLRPLPGARKAKPEVVSILKDLQRNYRIRMSSKLSESLYSSWRGERRSASHSIKQAPFFVLEHVNMPSNLVELGYLSNRKEAKKLSNPTYQKRLAQSIYEGIIRYKEFIDKQPQSGLN